jgi:Mor family transcriptional regulator
VRKRLADGENLKSLAKSYGVTHPTVIRALRKFEAPISTP